MNCKRLSIEVVKREIETLMHILDLVCDSAVFFKKQYR